MSDGISLRIALEIFNHPADLHFALGDEGGKFYLLLMRGPGHNFKTLVTSKPFWENRETAGDAIGSMLRAITIAAAEVMHDNAHPLNALVNPDSTPLDELTILTEERISAIVEQLKQTGEAATYRAAA